MTPVYLNVHFISVNNCGNYRIYLQHFEIFSIPYSYSLGSLVPILSSLNAFWFALSTDNLGMFITKCPVVWDRFEVAASIRISSFKASWKVFCFTVTRTYFGCASTSIKDVSKYLQNKRIIWTISNTNSVLVLLVNMQIQYIFIFWILQTKFKFWLINIVRSSIIGEKSSFRFFFFHFNSIALTFSMLICNFNSCLWTMFTVFLPKSEQNI